MPFCEKCGNEVSESAIFCANCGTAISKKEEKREIIFEGKVHKCPNCGEVLNSFDIKCPSCGFELNNKSISKTLQDFVEKVNECEKNISENSSYKSGWSSWGKGKRFWFIMGNVFFAFIPLIIYFSIPLIKIKSTPKLSKEELKLVSLIENFTFPNERESIVEAMMFAKGKMDFLSTKEIDRKNAYWFNLWKSKAVQLKQKSDLLFPNDQLVNQTYNQIIDKNNEVSKKIKTKIGIGVVLFVIVIIVYLSRNGTFEEIKNSNTTLIIPQTTLSEELPQIQDGKGRIVTNNSYIFSVEYYYISENDFENYKKECSEKGYTIDVQSDGMIYEAFNSQGYHLRATYYDKKLNIYVENKKDFYDLAWPETGVVTTIPKPKSTKGDISSSSDSCFIAYIGETSIEEFNEYVKKCIESGFNSDITQSKDYYRAKNKENISLKVEYEGNNIIFIRLDK